MKYNSEKQIKKLPNFIKLIVPIIIILILAAGLFGYKTYLDDLKPFSKSQQIKVVIIPKGSTSKQIGNLLFADKLIKSSLVFNIYIHLSKHNLQAGTYNLAPNMDVKTIVDILDKGKVATTLITIFPGTTVSDIKQNFLKFGFSQDQINQAFNIGLYSSSPLMSYVPTGTTSLEGLLWPDSFLVDSSTTPQTILNESMNETYQQITPQLKSAFSKEGLSVYQAITLASIIIKEVSSSSDQAQAAQVFLSRLSINMPLGSDVTALYGDAINNQPKNLSYDSPFNTLLHTGLPPTPIATISNSSLNAVANPATTSWLYFVTGDNGITYFSKTAAEQQQNTLLYCHKLCQ